MKLIYIAPANSMHSFKWINYFNNNFDLKFYTLYKIEEKFLQNYPNLKPIELVFTKNRIIDFFIAMVYLNIYTAFNDVKLIHGHTAGSHGLLASLIIKGNKVITVWGSDILIAGKNKFLKPLIRYILKRAKMITCDAVHMKNELQMLGVNNEKIKIINFGVDTNVLVKKSPKDSKFKKEYNISDTDKVIISLRNHWPIYDIETLIKATNLVVEKNKNVKVIIAGKGPLTKTYEKIISELNLNNYINLIGLYTGSDIPDMMAISDIYVSCPLSDAGIAASTAEAMSCEVPVIISNTGENNLWIDNEQNGFLFEAKNYNELAIKLIELLNDTNLANRMGRAGRDTIIEKNDYNNEMNKVIEMYKVLQNEVL